MTLSLAPRGRLRGDLSRADERHFMVYARHVMVSARHFMVSARHFMVSARHFTVSARHFMGSRDLESWFARFAAEETGKCRGWDDAR
jgi:hypothetical protein